MRFSNITVCIFFIFFYSYTQAIEKKPILISKENKQNHLLRYQPDWGSLDSRPLPSWYDEVKLGIFIHWGVFSVPSYESEWFWLDWKSKSSKYVNFMEKNYPPGFSYQDFAPEFKAELFDPKKWAELFSLSGAKYIVLTSKHHEGYTLWPSKYSFSWNAMDIGPHRDLIRELSNAIRTNTDIRFGLYHSLYEWYNPLYLNDKKNKFETQDFVQNKLIPEMKELILEYEPDVLWSDGDWEASDTYWKAKEFLAWLYNDSPVKDQIVVNDRWGKDIPCHHGDFYTCSDRYNPGVLQPHKWENAMTIDKKSWGFRRNADLADYMSIEELIKELVTTVSCGGNLAMNIGPSKDGTIAPIFQERLLQMGVWMGYNGEAIYGTTPWKYQNETDANVWYTNKEGIVYAILLKWPQNNTVVLQKTKSLFVHPNIIVSIVGCQVTKPLRWIASNDGMVKITLPDKAKIDIEWAWVLKIEKKKF